MTGSKKNSINLIESYLDELYPNPKCELNYSKDYELLISVVLSSQTTDKRVNEVTKILWSKYSLNTLAQANVLDIENIIKPIGTYTRKARYIIEIANILINEYNSVVPNDRIALEKMPGVGRKTTNVVLGLLYNVPSIAVDTHVNRVSKRLNLASCDDSVNIIENKLMKLYSRDNWVKRHHQMVLFGRYKCMAKNPLCEDCKLKNICKKKNQ